MIEKIHFYHTNDLHSHFENWPRIKSFLQKRNKWHEEEKETVFKFDIGDHIDRYHPYTEGTMGLANVEMMNELKYNAVTIGNNEGITLPKKELDHLYDSADFQVILGNLYDQDGKRPYWADPYRIYKTINGTKIAVIGVTAPYPAFYEKLGWKITPPFDSIKQSIKELGNAVDLIVLLSHLGMYEDEKIALEFPEIDIIFGAHTHHAYHQGKEINCTLLAAAGKHGQFIGHVEVEWDNTLGHIHSKKASLQETAQLVQSENDENEIKKWFHLGKESLREQVAILNRSLDSEWFYPSELGQLLTKAILEWCEGDCALINAGLLMHSLPKGPVTKFDIHQILPHPINPCIVELSGTELKEVLKQSFNQDSAHDQIRGMGFRGKVLGKYLHENVKWKESTQTIEVNGQPLNSKKKYRLATIDMFTFGRFFPELVRAPEKVYFLPEFIRDVLEWKLKKEFGHIG